MQRVFPIAFGVILSIAAGMAIDETTQSPEFSTTHETLDDPDRACGKAQRHSLSIVFQVSILPTRGRGASTSTNTIDELWSGHCITMGTLMEVS